MERRPLRHDAMFGQPRTAEPVKVGGVEIGRGSQIGMHGFKRNHVIPALRTQKIIPSVVDDQANLRIPRGAIIDIGKISRRRDDRRRDLRAIHPFYRWMDGGGPARRAGAEADHQNGVRLRRKHYGQMGEQMHVL